MLFQTPFRALSSEEGGGGFQRVNGTPLDPYASLFGVSDYTVNNPMSPYFGLQMRGLDASEYAAPGATPFSAPRGAEPALLWKDEANTTPAVLTTPGTPTTASGSTGGGTVTGTTGSTTTTTTTAPAPAAAQSLLDWWETFRASKYFWPVLLIAAVLIFGSDKKLKLK